MRKACPRCSNPVQMALLDSVSGEDGGVRLTMSGMPVAKCAKGHAAPFDGEFMLWLLTELKERQATLPAAEEKGLVFKKAFCACGKELGANTEPRAFPFDLAYEGAPAFRMELLAPVTRCPGCGKEQLRSAKAVRSHASQAIANLNDAAGFPHS